MEVGLYGKLPSHGDFLRRRIPDEFIKVWDVWLQGCIAQSRNDLAEQWLNVYLTSPVWRFYCDAGVCGASAYAGLMIPSVDRVGRYFPLTLAFAVSESIGPFTLARRADRWFVAAERLLVDTLSVEDIDFVGFDQQLCALDSLLNSLDTPQSIKLDLSGIASTANYPGSGWRIPMGLPQDITGITEQLLCAYLRDRRSNLACLWSEGSALVESSFLLLQGLPDPSAYTSLLNGDWRGVNWQTVPAEVSAPSDYGDTIKRSSSTFNFESAGLSDVGKVRNQNQDAWLARPELGIWVVADGMGGYRDGDVASRMVCDALADLPPPVNLELSVEIISERLQEVNAHLHRIATRSVNPVVSGSTVVVLLISGHRCAMLWAGDSRIYRYRDGQLAQLTKDHNWADETGETESDRNAITRAVGGEVLLNLDVNYDQVMSGDRYLLCSDGLTRELGDDQIASLMEESRIGQCVSGLVSAALSAGARDNLTVVLVETKT